MLSTTLMVHPIHTIVAINETTMPPIVNTDMSDSNTSFVVITITTNAMASDTPIPKYTLRFNVSSNSISVHSVAICFGLIKPFTRGRVPICRSK
jgi:hypothetical protein